MVIDQATAFARAAGSPRPARAKPAAMAGSRAHSGASHLEAAGFLLLAVLVWAALHAMRWAGETF